MADPKKKKKEVIKRRAKDIGGGIHPLFHLPPANQEDYIDRNTYHSIGELMNRGTLEDAELAKYVFKRYYGRDMDNIDSLAFMSIPKAPIQGNINKMLSPRGGIYARQMKRFGRTKEGVEKNAHLYNLLSGAKEDMLKGSESIYVDAITGPDVPEYAEGGWTDYIMPGLMLGGGIAMTALSGGSLAGPGLTLAAQGGKGIVDEATADITAKKDANNAIYSQGDIGSTPLSSMKCGGRMKNIRKMPNGGVIPNAELAEVNGMPEPFILSSGKIRSAGDKPHSRGGNEMYLPPNTGVLGGDINPNTGNYYQEDGLKIQRGQKKAENILKTRRPTRTQNSFTMNRMNFENMVDAQPSVKKEEGVKKAYGGLRMDDPPKYSSEWYMQQQGRWNPPADTGQYTSSFSPYSAEAAIAAMPSTEPYANYYPDLNLPQDTTGRLGSLWYTPTDYNPGAAYKTNARYYQQPEIDAVTGAAWSASPPKGQSLAQQGQFDYRPGSLNQPVDQISGPKLHTPSAADIPASTSDVASAVTQSAKKSGTAPSLRISLGSVKDPFDPYGHVSTNVGGIPTVEDVLGDPMVKTDMPIVQTPKYGIDRSNPGVFFADKLGGWGGIASGIASLAPVAYDAISAIKKPDEERLPSEYDKAMAELKNLRYDPSEERQAVRDRYAIDRYNAKQLGGAQGQGAAQVAGANFMRGTGAYSKFANNWNKQARQLYAQGLLGKGAARREVDVANVANEAARRNMFRSSLNNFSRFAQNQHLMANMMDRDVSREQILMSAYPYANQWFQGVDLGLNRKYYG